MCRFYYTLKKVYSIYQCVLAILSPNEVANEYGCYEVNNTYTNHIKEYSKNIIVIVTVVPSILGFCVSVAAIIYFYKKKSTFLLIMIKITYE